mgnify:CR=1 FL=1
MFKIIPNIIQKMLTKLYQTWSQTLYQKRRACNVCTRCGRDRDSARKKCVTCRTNENEWRKKTRSRRTGVERLYCQKNWDKRCVFLARTSDLKYKREIVDHSYITPGRLRTLRVLLRNKCYYCGVELQVDNRKQRNGLTIERLHGGMTPHSEDNCILCCHSCNCRKIGNKQNKTKSNLEIFGEIWKNYSKPQ